VNSIDYAKVDRFGLTKRQGAVATLRGGAAVCMEYSDLFIALMRAQGIPARAAYGYGYDTRESEINQIGHQWAEVYIPGVDEWVAVDVTWGESGQTLIGGDLNHLYTHIASSNPDQPPQVKARFYGSDPTGDGVKLNVQAIRELPSNPGMNPQDLLQKYSKSESSGTITYWQTVARNLTDAFQFSLGTVINNQDKGVTSLLSCMIFLLPFIAGGAFLGYNYKLKRQRLRAKPARMLHI
jgi:hypothetical protein